MNTVAGDPTASKKRKPLLCKGRGLTATEAHSSALAHCMPTAGRADHKLIQFCEPKWKRKMQRAEETVDRSM